MNAFQHTPRADLLTLARNLKALTYSDMQALVTIMLTGPNSSRPLADRLIAAADDIIAAAPKDTAPKPRVAGGRTD